MMLNREVGYQILSGVKVFFSDVDGTLTDGCTYYSSKGEELKRFNHKDGRGNYLLRMNSIRFGIITGETTDIVLRRADKINADFCFVGVNNKLELIKDFCNKNDLSLEQIAFIGDDTNDLDLIKNVGISFAVSDAVDVVKENANYICTKKGGDGAFREAVDFLILFLTSKQ